MINKRVRLFGEVLFDHYPDGQKILGGAPFNVAWHLQAFGQSPDFISRIGIDAQGMQIKQAMQKWEMSVENLQIDPYYATGSVQITVVNGEPHYDIVDNQAYDFIATDQLKNCGYPQDVLYHGTLALRHGTSAVTLDRLMAAHIGKIFVDVNLRAPWWQVNHINQLLDNAHWAKLNEDELMQLQLPLGSLKQAMQDFRAAHTLDVLVVTRGVQGAVAINQHNEFFEVTPTETVRVVDTVGAGDAFSAVLLLGLQQGWSLLLTLQRAQAFASAMVGRQGATVQDLNFYQPYRHAWQLVSSD